MEEGSTTETAVPEPVVQPAGAAVRGSRGSLLLVTGPGRSGTSLFSGLLQRLVFHVPQPEVQANATNPRGFGEPQWAIEFHQRLLREVNVHFADGRPVAWKKTEGVSTRPRPLSELSAWLEKQLEHSSRLVVKDVRTTWFLSIWREAARRLSVDLTVVMMLRHPAQNVRSRKLAYGEGVNAISKTIGWLNGMLVTEYKTRDLCRAVVRHEALLADWRGVLGAADTRLHLGVLDRATEAQVREADALVEPALYHARDLWEGLGVPERVRTLADETWEALGALADSENGEDSDALKRLDRLREEFEQLYEEARAIASDSVMAARAEGRRRGAAEAADVQPPERRGAALPAARATRLAARVVRTGRRRIAGGMRRGS